MKPLFKSIRRPRVINTVSFTALDQGSKMIIFQSILTAFEASSIFEATGVVGKICLSLKLNHHGQIYLVQIDETHRRILGDAKQNILTIT
jgi:hypothetical protein